jgi:uncharacterized RmlC-like cupin family protein
MKKELGYSWEDGSSDSVRVIHPAEMDADTLQTPGSLRMSAISAGQGSGSSMWAGIFVVEPSAMTGIHHHGDQETVVYVLEGEALVRWGNRGEYSATVRAGDFLPAELVAPSGDQSFE